jgi:hypothetical protein
MLRASGDCARSCSYTRRALPFTAISIVRPFRRSVCASGRSSGPGVARKAHLDLLVALARGVGLERERLATAIDDGELVDEPSNSVMRCVETKTVRCPGAPS